MPALRVCEQCGTEFQSKHISTVKRWCSRACYAASRSPVTQDGTAMTCPKCKDTWPLRDWYWDRRSDNPKGFRTPCRACASRESRREIVRLEMVAGEGYKVCCDCLEPYPRTTEYFSLQRGGRHFNSYCHPCARARAEKHRRENHEQVKQSMRESHERHKESRNEKKRLWYAENREAVLAQKAEYYIANALDIQLKVHERRLKVEAAGELVSKDDVAQLLKDQGYKCLYCGVALNQKNASIDHKLPISRGGTNALGNLCWACISCNKRKNAMTAEEFIERLRSM